jgi:hypothetical protein
MYLPTGFLAGFSERLHEILPVPVVQENILAAVFLAHDVIQRAGIFDAQLLAITKY